MAIFVFLNPITYHFFKTLPVPFAKSKNILLPDRLSNRQIVFLVMVGTVVRFCYGRFVHPWFAAPDQLAWQMGLDEIIAGGNWNCLQLGHAPHEGGSLLIGFCSLLFAPLKTGLPALSLVALLMDMLIRFCQVRIARNLFGSVSAAWFAAWTVLSIPLLLPWSVVNFGLHYLASVFPFVFFWLLNRYQDHRFLPQLLGMVCALPVSFAYENTLLIIPAIWVLIIDQTQKLRSVAVFAIVFSLLLLPHVLIRLWADQGYALEQGMIAGRDELGIFLQFRHLVAGWFAVLPAAFLLNSFPVLPPVVVLIIMLLFVYGGTIIFLQGRQTFSRWLMAGFIGVFLLVYSLSNFSNVDHRQTTYTAYRHLAFIVPLLVLLLIDGFAHAGKSKLFLLVGWIMVCGIASVNYMWLPYKDEQPAYRAAGWIMVQKYGMDVPRLFRLQQMVDTTYRHSVAMGFGWGLAAVLLRHPADTAAGRQLRYLIGQSPVQYRDDMSSGVQYAFAPGITPLLPLSSRQLFNREK